MLWGALDRRSGAFLSFAGGCVIVGGASVDRPGSAGERILGSGGDFAWVLFEESCFITYRNIDSSSSSCRITGWKFVNSVCARFEKSWHRELFLHLRTEIHPLSIVVLSFFYASSFDYSIGN